MSLTWYGIVSPYEGHIKGISPLAKPPNVAGGNTIPQRRGEFVSEICKCMLHDDMHIYDCCVLVSPDRDSLRGLI